MNSAFLRRTGPLVPLLAIFVLVLLNCPFTLSNGYGSLMGGVSTVGAMRVLDGQLPYRDFWTSATPGQFYLLALLFRLFGKHLMVEVLSACLISAAAAAACYLFLLRLTARPWLSAAPATILAAAFYNTGYCYRLDGYPPAILMVLAALAAVTTYYRRQNPNWLIGAGLAVGIATLFQQDLGLLTAAAICAALAVSGTGAPLPSRPRSLVIFCVAALAVILPIALYFTVAAEPMFWDALVAFPLRDVRLPGPKPDLNPFAFHLPAAGKLEIADAVLRYIKYSLPLAINLLSLPALIAALRQRRNAYAAAGAVVWIGFWLHYLLAHIHINTNIVTMSLYAATGAALLCSLRSPGATWNRRHQIVAVVLTVVWVGALSTRTAFLTLRRLADPAMVTLSMPRISGFRVATEEAATLACLNGAVQNYVAPGDPLYVGLTRHDIMITNDILAYFVLDRPAATRFHELHPAIADAAPAQQEMIRDLQRTVPSYVVRKAAVPDDILDRVKAEYQARLPDIGSTLLDQHLQQHYVPVSACGPYKFAARIQSARNPAGAH